MKRLVLIAVLAGAVLPSVALAQAENYMPGSSRIFGTGELVTYNPIRFSAVEGGPGRMPEPAGRMPALSFRRSSLAAFSLSAFQRFSFPSHSSLAAFSLSAFQRFSFSSSFVIRHSSLAAAAVALQPKELAKVEFEQRLGATLPLNAMFRDEHGLPVRLGNFFGERPVVLAFAYYECPNLCTVVLNALLESVRDLRQEAGRDYEIIVISINPADTAAQAAAKKQMYAMRYGRPGSAKGWHFLTGTPESVTQAANAAGFHSLYDPATRQFAHASGIAIVTPAGTLSRYFLGIEYPPKEVSAALKQASEHQIGTLTHRLLLLCFHYDPATGRYSLLISRVLQIAGLGTALALATGIVVMSRAERRNPRKAV